MEKSELELIVAGAKKIAWSHGGASTNGDASVTAVLVQKALELTAPNEVKAILIQLANQK